MNWHRSTPSVALRIGLVCSACLSAPPAVTAQDSRGAAVPVLSDSALVSVITVLPGERLYSLFGHTIIRVHDNETGLDVGFNFGTFDFPQTLLGGAGFVARFAYGKLDYMLSASRAPLDASAWYWSQEGRASIEQTLDLTPDQAKSLFALLMENARPENRVYRYDFFFDNCSTRPRDAFETVLGPELTVNLADPDRSFRQLLDPNLVGHPGVDFAMDIGLGQPSDRQATARDALFLPEFLLEWLGSATIGIPGAERPLVSRTDTLTWGPGAGERKPAFPWPTLVGWIIGAGLVLVTIRDRKAGRGARRWLDGTLFGVVGIAGFVLAFLTFVSLHTVTNGNLNLMWAIPTHVVPALTLLATRNPRWLRPYMLVTLALAALFLVGLPVWPQEIPAAVIPFVIGICARAASLTFPPANSEVQTLDGSSR
jgi:hypothetical protein